MTSTLAVRKKVKPFFLIQPDGEAVKVGESYLKLQYFQYDALLVENGKKFTIFNPGVSDVT